MSAFVRDIGDDSMKTRIAALALACAAATLSAPALACDIGVPPELKWSPKKVPGWVVYTFQPSAMIDGSLLYRKVKHTGLPSGAAEQKILAEHVNRAFSAMHGGKAGKIKVLSAQPAVLTRGATAKQYSVEITQPGDPTPKFAGVVIRENKAPKDIAVIVTPQDPDAPGDDVDRMIALAKKFASHPGFECTAGDGP